MRRFGLGALLSFLLSSSCADRPAQQESPGEPISARDLKADSIAFQFGIYYLPMPRKNPLDELDLQLKSPQAFFKRVEKPGGQEPIPAVAARMERDPQYDYPPPSASFLERFGHGLTPEQVTALQKTQSVVILDFAYSQEQVWPGLRAALDLTYGLAKATGGLLWDETTREVFTPEAWMAQRITNWSERVPEIQNYTVIHAYETDGSVRAISLGMEKFGLPDIVVDKFGWSLNRNVGHTINLFAQMLAEGAVVQKTGEFDLDFRSIRHPKVRSEQIDSLKKNATGIALLSLRTGKWEEGDPQNRLIEITFSRGVGPDLYARQTQILSAAFGSEDSLVQVEHDEELERASRRARSKLPGLRAEFNNGLAPGEFIQVKAPFETPDGGQEWMWVEVVSWKGDRISGLLQNEPFDIPSLRSGQMVEVSESELFDYIRTRANGTVEGNGTGTIIDRRSGERR